MTSDTRRDPQLTQRLLVLGVGLAVTLVSSTLVRALWMGHIFEARFAISKVLAFAAVAVGFWLIRSGRLSRASLRRTLPRCLVALVGLAVIFRIGMLLPAHGFLWSPLPWEPRAFDLAQQKLFWTLGPPIYGLGLWLLDQARLESLRLTDRRLVVPLVLLAALVTAAVLTNDYLYAHLDHGQGG